MKDVIAQLNDEFTAEIKKVETANPHDEMEVVPAGEYINWKEVIAVYACKITESSENPLDVITMDDERLTILRTIMFEMNSITHELKSETREVVTTNTADDGTETATTESVVVNILIITITNKTTDQIVADYRFTESQKKSLEELLHESNNDLWVDLLEEIIADGGFIYTGGTLNWPCQGTFTSGFGPRWGSVHQGIDIANVAGTPIYAAADGEVFYSQWNSGGYGYQVRIDHGGGIVTSYAHNSSLVASAGQKVKRGDLIARMGTTGDSTGNHCHFEVRVNGVAQDPLNWL